MMASNPVNLWTSAEHAHEYLERADLISHRGEGESVLLEFISPGTRRILDLGTGMGGCWRWCEWRTPMRKR
jgi:hypothetical protein